MKMSCHVTLSGLALLLSMAWTPVSMAEQHDADDAAQRAQARAHRALGQAALAEGDHVGALRELQTAFELSRDPELRYDLGRCHRELGHLVEGRQEFQLYLAEVDPSQIPAERRQEVEQALAELNAGVALLEIRVPVDDAVVRVDGEEVGRSPLLDPVTVESGQHEVTVTAEGQPPFTTEVTVTAGERNAVEVVFGAVEETVAEPGGDSDEQPSDSGQPSSRRRLSQAWFWASLGLAVALAIGGTVTGALVMSTGEEYDDLTARCMTGEADACSQGPDTRSRGETLRTTTNVLLPIAGGFAAVSVILAFFTDWSGGESSATSRFQLTAGSGDIGLGAGVTF